jgi:hypothetical protein
MKLVFPESHEHISHNVFGHILSVGETHGLVAEYFVVTPEQELIPQLDVNGKRLADVTLMGAGGRSFSMG